MAPQMRGGPRKHSKHINKHSAWPLINKENTEKAPNLNKQQMLQGRRARRLRVSEISTVFSQNSLPSPFVIRLIKA